MIKHYTNPIDKIQSSDVSQLVQMALQEDCPQHDITSEAIFFEQDFCRASLLTRENGVLCGIAIVDEIRRQSSGMFSYEFHLHDGDTFQSGQKLASIEGNLLTLLRVERVLLNFLQYLSGIATQTYEITRKYNQLVILDTRKTIPGYRKLAKYAVYCGGGSNHRIHLSEMAMLKDNHISMAGSIKNAVQSVRTKYPGVRVELEIDNLQQLEQAIQAQPDLLLLDNFSLEDTYTAVEKLNTDFPEVWIECSGGITPEKLESLAKIGGIGVSMGYLTHTNRFLDLSLDIEKL